MADEVNPRRKYVSTRRQEQAARTRVAVLDAALKLFSEGGWTSTTIAAIAREAGVSKETIYAVWGTKTAVAAELVQRAVRGDAPDTPLLEQAGPAGVVKAPNAAARLELFATGVAGLLVRVAPLVDAIRTAAATEPEAAELYAQLQAGRRRNLTIVAEALRPDLRDGLDVAEAVEEIWRQASPELFLLLTRHEQWSVERYARWLARTLKRLLLAP